MQGKINIFMLDRNQTSSQMYGYGSMPRYWILVCAEVSLRWT